MGRKRRRNQGPFEVEIESLDGTRTITRLAPDTTAAEIVQVYGNKAYDELTFLNAVVPMDLPIARLVATGEALLRLHITPMNGNW